MIHGHGPLNLALAGNNTEYKSSTDSVKKEIPQVPDDISIMIDSIMIDENYHARVRYLDDDTFDHKLLCELNKSGYITENYHALVADNLKSGYLWVQNGVKKDKNFILWANQFPSRQPTINCAHLSSKYVAVILNQQLSLTKTVTVYSYKPKFEYFKKEMWIHDFQNTIKEYLITTPSISGIDEHYSLSPFQKQLGLVPIVFKVKVAAHKEFALKTSMDDFNNLKSSVIIGADSLDKPFNPNTGDGIKLIEISKYFLYGRLARLIHEEKKDVEEPVAPVIRTWEAHSQLSNLRRFQHDDFSKISEMDNERKVTDLSYLDRTTFELLRNKSLMDLHTWLVFDLGDNKKTAYKFEKLENGISSSEERLELTLDFNEEWILKCQLFEKV